MAVVLSIACHAAAVGAGLARWLSASDPSDATMVLVELAAAEAPQGPDVAGTPAAVDRGEQPASMAVDSTTVERRLATLAAENDALAAGLADAELRIAAMEDAHRQEIAAHDTTANDLGERVAALTAEKEALAAELEAGRLRTAALEEELEARRKAEDAAVAELRSAHDRLVSALRQRARFFATFWRAINVTGNPAFQM